MSDSGSDGPGRREVAHRLFAAEFEDADLSYSESDEERAPNYVVTPSGARVNRLFVVGVLTEVEQVAEDVLRGRVVDPTGAFVLYAGQYQPDEQAFLDRAEPPMFVAVTGKARTFQPEDADTVYTSVRPETISQVDADTRDRWTVNAAERTLDRVATCAAAARMDPRGDALAAALRDQGVDNGLAEGVGIALDHYGTAGTYLAALRELALDAARVVAGHREEAESLIADPGAGDDGPLADLAGGLGDAARATEPAAGVETEAGAEADTQTGAQTEPPAAETATESAETTATDQTASGEPAASTQATEPSEGTEPETAATTGAAEATDAAGGAESTETVETAGMTAESTAGTDATTEDVGTGTGTEAVDGADSPGDIGDFEGGDLGSDEGDGGLDDFEPEEFELDEEEREEIEAEYGTDFQSGTEVDEPGETDIDAPNPESEPEPGPGSETGGGPAADSGADTEAGAGPANEESSEPAPASGSAGEATTESASGTAAAEVDASGGSEATETGTGDSEATETGTGGSEATEAPDPEDLEDAVVDLMDDLDEGDGVAREDLVGATTDRYGVETGAVEDAVQDALMGGRCYEPDDGTLKPI